MRGSPTRKLFSDVPVGLHPAVSPALGGDVYASGLPFFTKTARFSSFHSLKEFLSFASCMQQVNLLRCRSVPMCRVVSITAPVVFKLASWSRRALRRSPFSYPRSLTSLTGALQLQCCPISFT